MKPPKEIKAPKPMPAQDAVLIADITDWIKDFEKQNPGNLSLPEDGDDTFEGSAYVLLVRVLMSLTK